MTKEIEELTLLLLYLTAWEEVGFYVDALNNLTTNGYLYPTRNKNKSITLTIEGAKLAETLKEKYLSR